MPDRPPMDEDEASLTRCPGCGTSLGPMVPGQLCWSCQDLEMIEEMDDGIDPESDVF